MSRISILSPIIFDYPKFKADLYSEIKKSNTTLDEVSSKKLFRSAGYISQALSKKNMPFAVAMALCDMFGLAMRDYEYKPEEQKPVQPVQPVIEEKPFGGFSCEMKIDPAFNTIMVRLLKDGEPIAIGRSYLRGTSDSDVAQSFSYAAHMAYKVCQQTKMEAINSSGERIVFKDWIKRYEKYASDEGAFARYVESHYAKFPSTGRKDMIGYLAMNGGAVHIGAFRNLFETYLKWYEAQR